MADKLFSKAYGRNILISSANERMSSGQGSKARSARANRGGRLQRNKANVKTQFYFWANFSIASALCVCVGGETANGRSCCHSNRIIKIDQTLWLWQNIQVIKVNWWLESERMNGQTIKKTNERTEASDRRRSKLNLSIILTEVPWREWERESEMVATLSLSLLRIE